MNKFYIGISGYRFFSRAYFYLPFLMIYFYLQDIKFMWIELLLAIYGVGALFGTNYLKNKLSNKFNSRFLIIISEVLKVIGLSFLLFDNLPYLFVGQFIIGLSYAIGSGEDTIIIRNIFENANEVQQKSNSLMFLSLLLAGIIGSFLFDINIRLPILVTIGATILSIFSIVTVSYQETNNVKTNKEKSKINYYWVFYYSFIRGIILTLFTGFLPFILFVEKHINIYLFIIILSSYTIMGMFSSRNLVNKIENPLITIILLLISLGLIFSNNIFLLVVGMLILGIVSGITRPLTVKMLEKEKSNIPINLKKAELYYSVINICLLISFGLFYENEKGLYVFAICLLTLTLYSIILLKLRRKAT